MKKITVFLFTAMLTFSSGFVLADDASNDTTSNADNNSMPKPPMPVMPAGLMPTASPTAGAAGPSMMPSPVMSMTPKTVVATSDGGIVIVEGNRITKFDKDLQVTKSIELTNDENTGADKSNN